jgi:hypothetical protein
MAVDFQVVFPSSVIPISSVRVIPGLVPRTLDIIGEDFRSVDEVRVNDVRSPSFVVLSQYRLLAQVPPSIKNDTITSVGVISNRLTLTNQSLLRFRLGAKTTKASGILRLMQSFIKVLFTTPGRDIFSPRMGGNGWAPLGANFSSRAGSSIVADFIIAVNNTAKQLIAIQGRNPSIPREERLLSARVQNANFNRNEAALIVGIELVNQTGQRALSQLML